MSNTFLVGGGGPATARQVELSPFQLFVPQDNTARLCYEADKVFCRYKDTYNELKKRFLAGEELSKDENLMFLALLPLKYACTPYRQLETHYKLWMHGVFGCAGFCCCAWLCGSTPGKLGELCLNEYPDGICCKCSNSYKACATNTDCCKCFGYDKSEYNVVVGIARSLMTASSVKSFYLIHKSHILQANSLTDLKFDVIEPQGKLVKFEFSRYPRYTFVSHKWYGDAPDSGDKKFFNHLRHLTDVVSEEFFWIDWCCFQQDWQPAENNPKRTEMLQSIPRILLGSSHVELFRQNTGYQESVWCAMESVTTIDDGFLKHYGFKIRKFDDFHNVFPPLFRMCIQYSSLKSVIENVRALESQVRVGNAGADAKARLETMRQEVQDIINENTLYGYGQKSCCGKDWWLANPLLWTKNPVLIQLCLYYFIQFESFKLDPEEMIREPKREKIGRSVVPKYSETIIAKYSAFAL